MTIAKTLKIQHRVAGLLLAASVSALLIAFAAQHLGGLQPCILCIYQRIPFAIAIVLGIWALMLSGKPLRLVLALMCLVFLANMLLSGFHVGVEQHWWQGTAECSGTVSGQSVDDIAASLMAAPVVRCDEVAWALFGISMTGYNLLFCLGLAGIAAWGATRPESRIN